VRFHLASDYGDGASLAYHLQRTGHEVTWSVRHKDARPMLQGLVRYADWPPRGAITLVDAVGMHIKDHPRIGGNALEVWETVRKVGMEAMLDHGIEIPDTIACRTVAEAITALRDLEGEWYFKPDGDVPKSMTRMGDPAWLIRFLEWARPQLAKCPSMILQRRVADAVEVDAAVWLDGQSVGGYELALEEKKFLAGNKGPSTGCQANLVWVARENDRAVMDTIGRFVPTLLDSGYVGIASINGLWTPDQRYYGLEFTMRFGWDATQAEAALYGGGFAHDLASLASGETGAFTRNLKEGAMTLRLSVPPQPQEGSRDHKDWADFPLPESLLEDEEFYPDDLAVDRTGQVRLATGSGFVGVLATTGKTLIGMRRHLTSRAEKHGLKDGMWRPDPVATAEETIGYLRKHHLAKDPFDP
jgi:phosphoribosylamine-glycine ligase